MDLAQGDGREQLDDEVAVSNRVDRVRRDAIEAELGRVCLAVEREAGTGDRARAERRDVEPAAGVRKAATVPVGMPLRFQ